MKKIKRITIEADFKDFDDLRIMFKEILQKAEEGIPYVYEAPFGNRVKSKYQFTLDFLDKTPWHEKEIDGKLHCIIKSKI
jgi:hypothetical protein